jgi:hypothetical protein
MQDQERRLEAEREIRLIVESMAGIQLRTSKRNEPNTALVDWCTEYLANRVATGAAQALTPLLRLPDLRWANIAEVLKGEGAYVTSSPRLTAILKNVSSGPVLVEHGLRWVPTPVSTQAGWVEGEVGRGVPLTQMIEPGQTVELQCHYAVAMLRKYCLDSWPTALWDAASVPEHTYLVEVGFGFDQDGQRVRHCPVQAQQQPRKRRQAQAQPDQEAAAE